MTGSDASSPLDRLIPPEIKDDRFYRAIEDVAATSGVREILEIGSSSGAGSTEAWARGAERNQVRPRLHCLEVSDVRFAALVDRWRGHDFVVCHNVSSVPVESFPSVAEVTRFYQTERSALRRTPLETVLDWRAADIAYLSTHGLSLHGIRRIKAQYRIDTFDAVLIDGSEFTGMAELEEVYGARFLLLDDTRTFKNWHNLRRLEVDPAYMLVKKGRWPRNGFAIFERREPA